ncbi:Vps62-related protein [Dickeya oryzae]|uniref:Vps62-related protein n=1 Tax=Dickeya oryzae TaxID=1240404 RepID=UPI001AECFCC4|nr:Vps62-related protein [Dickeya oryzae]
MSDSFLQFQSTNTFVLNNIINDVGSGADQDLSLWCPVVPSGWSYLGLYPTNNYNNPPNPSGPQWLIQGSDTTCLSAPTGFSTIWTCSHNDRPSNLGIYAPLAPNGYIAIGSIAVMDFNSPPTVGAWPNLMCVRQDLCQQVTLSLTNRIWCDQGSRAPLDVSVWLLPNALTCVATVGNGYPDEVSVWDVKNPNHQ